MSKFVCINCNEKSVFPDMASLMQHYRLEHREARNNGKRHSLSWGDKCVILRRQGKKCASCGIDYREGLFEYHHKIKLSDGGKDSLSNIEAICYKCHRDVHYYQWERRGLFPPPTLRTT